MKRPQDLSKKDLVSLVEQIRDLLYLDMDSNRVFLNPEKEWNVGTIDEVAGILNEFNLVPEEEADLPVKKERK